MDIEYFHDSAFGNGEMVAEEFKKQMKSKGIDVGIHHVHEMAKRAARARLAEES